MRCLSAVLLVGLPAAGVHCSRAWPCASISMDCRSQDVSLKAGGLCQNVDLQREPGGELPYRIVEFVSGTAGYAGPGHAGSHSFTRSSSRSCFMRNAGPHWMQKIAATAARRQAGAVPQAGKGSFCFASRIVNGGSAAGSTCLTEAQPTRLCTNVDKTQVHTAKGMHSAAAQCHADHGKRPCLWFRRRTCGTP